MSDRVTCGECATHYDSATDAFCPRCGSTSKGTVLAGALVSARRNDPGRRRVQAAGALLLVVGLMFLVSAVVALSLSVQKLADLQGEQLPATFADQAGGTLVLIPADTRPYDLVLTSPDGEILANATGHVGEFTHESPKHAALLVSWTRDNVTVNGTAIVMDGDVLRVPLEDLSPEHVALSSTLRSGMKAGLAVLAVTGAGLSAGGLFAILLRAWPVAAIGAILGLLAALVALAVSPLFGLLFALPFGAAGYFILRGRRHFTRKA